MPGSLPPARVWFLVSRSSAARSVALINLCRYHSPDLTEPFIAKPNAHRRQFSLG